MENAKFDVIVIGAGFGGLCASYYLEQYGLKHVVFERGRVGESWRSQRWDSFRLNSTNKLNVLPGINECGNEDAFSSALQFVSSLDQYATMRQLPVVENTKVISVEKKGDLFSVTICSNDVTGTCYGKQVLVASGSSNEKQVPLFSKNISKDIQQLHTGEYRNAHQLPDGAVLVVGGAQSGIQIAEDLVNAGRKVFLSTSKVARIPRWYRGRDIFYWLQDMQFFNLRPEDVSDPAVFQMKPPQIAGTGSGRDTVSLQALARKGATILGKMENANEQQAIFQPNAAMHVQYADGFSKKVKEMIDAFIEQNNLVAPPPHHDEADLPDVNASCACPDTSIDLKANKINTIIWSTGFYADHSFIKLPVFDESGKLKHEAGTTVVEGLYFLGYPWMRSRKSTILFGLKDDAEFITQKIYEAEKPKDKMKTIA